MDISELLSNLSNDDMQKLKETANSLLSPKASASNSSSELPVIDPKLLGSISKVAGIMNVKDPRCDFLLSLKPLLGAQRQHRVDEAVQLMRMITVLPRIMEMGGLK